MSRYSDRPGPSKLRIELDSPIPITRMKLSPRRIQLFDLEHVFSLPRYSL